MTQHVRPGPGWKGHTNFRSIVTAVTSFVRKRITKSHRPDLRSLFKAFQTELNHLPSLHNLNTTISDRTSPNRDLHQKAPSSQPGTPTQEAFPSPEPCTFKPWRFKGSAGSRPPAQGQANSSSKAHTSFLLAFPFLISCRSGLPHFSLESFSNTLLYSVKEQLCFAGFHHNTDKGASAASAWLITYFVDPEAGKIWVNVYQSAPVTSAHERCLMV